MDREPWSLPIHERPAVILLDLQLSMIDGLQVLKRLKGQPRHQSSASDCSHCVAT